MAKFTNLILILFLLIISCCKQSESEYLTEYLTGNRLSSDSLYLRSYPKVLIGDTLISSTTSRYANYCVSVFRNDSLITLGTIFPKGNGYGEYQSVRLGSNPKEILSTIDVMGNSSIMKKFEQNHIQNFLKGGPINRNSSYLIPEMAPLRYVTDCFVNVNDSIILINGSPYDHPDYLFSLVNIRNGVIKPLEYWPNDGYEGNPIPKQSVYTDNALILNGPDRYLYKCGEGRFVSISGHKINVQRELFTELPDYRQSNDGLNYILNNRSIRWLECDVTDQNIYVLLVEKNSKGEIAANWTESDSGNEVLVYNWM